MEGALSAPLNLDALVSAEEFAARRPFKALHVRRREVVVTDRDDDCEQIDLDLADAGTEQTPADWCVQSDVRHARDAREREERRQTTIDDAPDESLLSLSRERETRERERERRSRSEWFVSASSSSSEFERSAPF